MLFTPDTKWEVLKVVEGADLKFFESLNISIEADNRTAVQRIIFRRQV